MPRLVVYIIYYLLTLGFISNVASFDYAKLTQFNTDNGLNQSGVNRIIQDRDGYLWISSLQGVNRYDGYRITQVHSPDKILLSAYIDLLFEDSHGIIWIGAAPSHNYQLDKKNDRLLPITLTVSDEYQLESATLSNAVEDKNGNIWFSTYSEVFFYDRKQQTFELMLSMSDLFANESKEHLFRRLLLVEKQLLLATSNGLFSYNIDTKTAELIHHTPNEIGNGNGNGKHDQNNVKSLILNEYGKVLVGTVEGLFELNLKPDPTRAEMARGKLILESLNIWEIIEKPDFYWLATDKGLFQMTKSGDLKFIFKYSDTPYNTSDDDIVSMMEDREGILWFGSRADGFFKWHPNTAIKRHLWQQGVSGEKLSNNTVTSTLQSPDGTIWMGTENGLNKIDPITNQVTQLMVNPNEKQVISDSTIISIAHSQDKIWLNTFGGLKKIDEKTLQIEPIIFPEENKKVFTDLAFDIYFLDKDNLAILNEQGIYNYEISKNQLTLVESSKTDGKVAKQLFAIFDTATGVRDSYFVSGTNRLAKYSRESGRITNFHQLKGGSNLQTNPSDIYRDGNKLWVTYPNVGLYILDANSGRELHFISEQSIDANTMMDMFADKKGYVWVTSNEGLIRINKKNYSARIFDSNDGFITSEFNAFTKSVLSNGEVMLGSVKGAFQFQPDEMTSDTALEVAPHVSSISLLSREIEPRYGNFDDYHVELLHSDFGLKLEFSALLFDKPKQVKFRYWFEGDSSTKPTTTDKSELFFPAIKPGLNTLNISAINYDNGIETAPVKIKITSLPHPWLSWRAYAFYIVVLVLIVAISFYRYRGRMNAKIKAHLKLKQSEERLNLALKGGNSGLWDWHAIDNGVYEPRMIQQDSDSKNETIHFDERLQAIHESDRTFLATAWQKFLEQKNGVFDAIYRMKDEGGNWAWYRDMATVTEWSEQHRPLRVTGTYTNITDRKEARDQMRLFSKAFESTRDIVFVLNHEKSVVAANQSFYKTTEYPIDKIMFNGIFFLSDFQGSRKIVAKIFRYIHLQKHWEGEGQLIRELKSPLSVLINATSFIDNDNNLNYVFALTDISKQKQAENELRKLANYDSLTGLPNRALLLDRIAHAIEHCKRRQHQLAVFFIDLDRFKQINDTLGHDIGDLLLINVAHTIRRSIRHDDTVARLGGDEFVVLLEDIDGIDSINRIAQNIIEQMKEPMILRDHKVTTSPSIGIALYPSDGADSTRLLKHADVAMYHAKNAGRNNFQYFENSMNNNAKKRLSLEVKLRQAIKNDDIFLHYQPQYVINDGRLCGMEALARWKTSSGVYIPPSEFIPIAEDLGLIIPLTERLIEVGFANLSRWHSQGYQVGLAFNLSARHLHHYDFNDFVDKLLKQYQLDTRLLEFELTESVLMKDISVACRIFGKLAEKGIELALDDFGTGYSSLKYLSQLPINKLKIDRSFVSKIGSSVESDSIINTIISLAKSLNLRTVAEGIESREQLEFLHHAGVHQAQGYLTSKPLELEEVEKLIKKGRWSID